MEVCALVRDPLDLPGRVAEQLMGKVGQGSRGRDILPDLRDLLVVGAAPGQTVANEAHAVLSQAHLSRVSRSCSWSEISIGQ